MAVKHIVTKGFIGTENVKFIVTNGFGFLTEVTDTGWIAKQRSRTWSATTKNRTWIAEGRSKDGA